MSNDASGAPRFATSFRYSDRRTKAEYVWNKYRPILEGRLLDVGADEQHLERHLPPGTEYVGIGLGGHPDLRVDLEKEPIPFPDRSFDCVLCLDVLEHLDNIHRVFDELCRVSARYVLISLPNPWGSFYRALRRGDYGPDGALKQYGLPPDPPADRHKWFFGPAECRAFVVQRARHNAMRAVQLDFEGSARDSLARRWSRARVMERIGAALLFRRNFEWPSLKLGPLWALLEHSDGE